MTYALQIDRLQKAYGQQQVLDGVSFDVPQGSIMGLLGPNGAGKSTLIRSIMGIIAPDAGTITIGGKPWSREAVQRLGYLPEERGLYKDMKVGEQAVYFARLKGMEKDAAIRSLRHWFERLEVDGWWNKKVTDVSKGMAQKIQFICTIVHSPDILILDEPTNHLDIEGVQALAEGLKSYEGTIIFVSHDRWFVSELASRVIEITHEGLEDYHGTYEEFMRRRDGVDHLDADAVLEHAKATKRASKKKTNKYDAGM